MTLLNIDASERDRVLVARLKGEIDLSNAAGIRSSLIREMSNALLGLVLDLTDVRYLDSAGIRAIYELREDLQARGQELRLVVPEDSVISTALELVDAPSEVGIVSDAESALGELSERGDPT